MVTEKATYYVETWINGNKNHVIKTLAYLLTSDSIANRIDYTNILSKFIAYDSDLALTVIDRVLNKIYGKLLKSLFCFCAILWPEQQYVYVEYLFNFWGYDILGVRNERSQCPQVPFC